MAESFSSTLVRGPLSIEACIELAMAAAVGQRPYQVVVWGATGFTGRLVCEHLVRDYKVGANGPSFVCSAELTYGHYAL